MAQSRVPSSLHHPKKAAPAPPAPPGQPPPRVGWGGNYGARAPQHPDRGARFPGLIREEWGWERRVSRRTAAARGQELPAGLPLASRRREHPGGALGLGRPTEQVWAPSAKGFPKSHAPTLPANGASEPCSAPPRLLQARKPLPLEEPNRTVTVTGSSVRVLGRMRTGGDGNCVASSGLGSFLPQPGHGAGARGELGHGAAAPS